MNETPESETMETGDELLAEAANATTLDELVAAGLLSPGAREVALRQLRSPAEWTLWLDRLLLTLGSALVLAGILFFFAYNWEAMGRFLRLGLLEALVVAAALAATWKGLEETAGRALLTAAGVLVGVFLAVFGQTYQTGADAYTLFLGWGLLIGPWVLVSRSAAMWMLWLLLANTTLGLWSAQVALPAGFYTARVVPLLFAALNLGALAARERVLARGHDWLDEGWTRWMPLGGVLVILTGPTCGWISTTLRLRPHRTAIDIPSGVESCLALALVWAAVWGYYRLRARDLVATNLAALSVGAVAFVTGITLVRELHLERGLEELTLRALLCAGVTIGVAWGVTAAMRRIAASIRREEEP